MMTKGSHIVWQPSKVAREDRNRKNRHRSCAIWLTGLSGSGKSTLAFALEQELFALDKHVCVLDGDNIRHGLSRDLGFSQEDRRENLRRIGETAKLFAEAGVIAIAAFISPDEQDRAMVRSLFGPDEFIEVYIRCPLEECERRDPKGLYEKARKGLIAEFTGISAPYDIPLQPELTVDSERLTVEQSVRMLIGYLEQRGILNC